MSQHHHSQSINPVSSPSHISHHHHHHRHNLSHSNVQIALNPNIPLSDNELKTRFNTFDPNTVYNYQNTLVRNQNINPINNENSQLTHNNYINPISNHNYSHTLPIPNTNIDINYLKTHHQYNNHGNTHHKINSFNHQYNPNNSELEEASLSDVSDEEDQDNQYEEKYSHSSSKMHHYKNKNKNSNRSGVKYNHLQDDTRSESGDSITSRQAAAITEEIILKAVHTQNEYKQNQLTTLTSTNEFLINQPTPFECKLCLRPFHTTTNHNTTEILSNTVKSIGEFQPSVTDFLHSRIPRLLHCGHSFCQVCLHEEYQKQLQKFYESNDYKTDLLNSAVLSSFTCPLGCVATPLNTTGIQSLTLNTPLMEAISYLQSRKLIPNPSTLTVDSVNNIKEQSLTNHDKLFPLVKHGLLSPVIVCEQCEFEPATVYCSACSIDFCVNCCRSAHTVRAYQKHATNGAIVPLHVKNQNNTDNGTNSKCLFHPDQIANLYCEDCNEIVCRDCISTYYQGLHSNIALHHITNYNSTIVTKIQQDLTNLLTQSQTQFDKFTSHLTEKSNSITSETNNILNLESQLTENFNNIKLAINNTIEERFNKLKTELILIHNERTNSIQTTRAEFSLIYARLSALIEQMKKINNNSSGIDQFTMRTIKQLKHMINTLLTIDSVGFNVHLSNLLLRVNNVDLLSTVQSSINNYGVLIGRLPTPPVINSIIIIGNKLTINYNGLISDDNKEFIIEFIERPRYYSESNDWSIEMKKPYNNITDIELAHLDKIHTHRTLDIIHHNNTELATYHHYSPHSTEIWTRLNNVTADKTSFETILPNSHSVYQYRICARNLLGQSGWTYSKLIAVPGIQFNYNFDMDTAGLFYYLGVNTANNTSGIWTNPASFGSINISASSVLSGEVTSLTSRRGNSFTTLNRPFSWIKFDLFSHATSCNYKFQLASYTLVNSSKTSLANRALRCWRLQGSNNDSDWILIREHTQDNGLTTQPNSTCTFTIANSNFHSSFRYFRLIQTDFNAGGDHHLTLGGVEFYGFLTKE